MTTPEYKPYTVVLLDNNGDDPATFIWTCRATDTREAISAAQRGARETTDDFVNPDLDFPLLHIFEGHVEFGDEIGVDPVTYNEIKPVKEYVVDWTIDVSATGPREAAEEAKRIMRDPESMASVFTVIECDGGPQVVIDLDEEFYS